MEKRTSKAISRKIIGSRNPRASRIAKQRKTVQGTGVRQGCTTVHPRQNNHSRRIRTHGRPCVGARPCHIRSRAVLHFFGLYILFSFIFWGTSSILLGAL
uniref:Uncharacterized protein n=1 Tax=Opuntia streptacantha TaxID=393608 RepID=A0A7C9DK38_OPUST